MSRKIILLFLFIISINSITWPAAVILRNGGTPGIRDDTLVISWVNWDANAEQIISSWDTTFIILAFKGSVIRVDTLTNPTDKDIGSSGVLTKLFEHRVKAGDSIGWHSYYVVTSYKTGGTTYNSIAQGFYYLDDIGIDANTDSLQRLATDYTNVRAAYLDTTISSRSTANADTLQAILDSLQNQDNWIASASVLANVRDTVNAIIDTLQRFTKPTTDTIQAIIDSIQNQDNQYIILRDTLFAVMDTLQRFTKPTTDTLQAIIDTLQLLDEKYTDLNDDSAGIVANCGGSGGADTSAIKTMMLNTGFARKYTAGSGADTVYVKNAGVASVDTAAIARSVWDDDVVARANRKIDSSEYFNPATDTIKHVFVDSVRTDAIVAASIAAGAITSSEAPYLNVSLSTIRDSLQAVLDTLQRFTKPTTDTLQAIIDTLQLLDEKYTDLNDDSLGIVQNCGGGGSGADTTAIKTMMLNTGFARKYTAGSGADTVYVKNIDNNPWDNPKSDTGSGMGGWFADWFADLNDDSTSGGGADSIAIVNGVLDTLPAAIYAYTNSGNRLARLGDSSSFQGAAAGLTASEMADTLANRGMINSGSGVYPCSVFVLNSDDSSAIVNAMIRITALTGSDVIASGSTNSAGMAIVNLNSGSWACRIAPLVGYNFNPVDTITLTGAKSDTIWGTAVSATPPSPDLVTIKFWVQPVSGTADTLKKVVCRYQLRDADSTEYPLTRHITYGSGNNTVLINTRPQYDTTNTSYMSFFVYPNSALSDTSSLYYFRISYPNGTIVERFIAVPDTQEFNPFD